MKKTELDSIKYEKDYFIEIELQIKKNQGILENLSKELSSYKSFATLDYDLKNKNHDFLEAKIEKVEVDSQTSDSLEFNEVDMSPLIYFYIK